MCLKLHSFEEFFWIAAITRTKRSNGESAKISGKPWESRCAFKEKKKEIISKMVGSISEKKCMLVIIVIMEPSITFFFPALADYLPKK